MFGFAQRLLAMGQRKKIVEEKVTSLLIPAFEHLGRAFATDLRTESKLCKEWEDEIARKFLQRSVQLIAVSNSRISRSEFKRWVLGLDASFVGGASFITESPKYRQVAKRFSSNTEARAAAIAFPKQKLLDLIVELFASDQQIDPATTAKNLMNELNA